MQIIAGKYRFRKLQTPHEKVTRPTSSKLRQAFFNICQNDIEGVDFLDLFAGSGAMGLEALSRGAASATFIDHHRDAIRCIKHNCALLQAETQCTIMQTNALTALRRLAVQEKKFYLIYIDPPYALTHRNSLAASICSDVLHALDGMSILHTNGSVYIEREKGSAEAVSLQHMILAEQRIIGPSLLEQYIYK